MSEKTVKKLTDTIFGWHFTTNHLRDGRPVPPVGEWLYQEGPIRVCHNGLHGCTSARDALEYAPLDTTKICRTEYGGVIDRSLDKFAAEYRKVHWWIPAERALRAYTRWCALQVVHLWDEEDGDSTYCLATGSTNHRGKVLYESSKVTQDIPPTGSYAKKAQYNAAKAAYYVYSYKSALEEAYLVQQFSESALENEYLAWEREGWPMHHLNIHRLVELNGLKQSQNQMFEQIIHEAHEGKTVWEFPIPVRKHKENQ